MNNQKSTQYIAIVAIIILVLAFAYLIYASKPTDTEISANMNPVSVINTSSIQDLATQIHSRQSNANLPISVSQTSRNNPFQSE